MWYNTHRCTLTAKLISAKVSSFNNSIQLCVLNRVCLWLFNTSFTTYRHMNFTLDGRDRAQCKQSEVKIHFQRRSMDVLGQEVKCSIQCFGNLCTLSQLFNYLENCKTHGIKRAGHKTLCTAYPLIPVFQNVFRPDKYLGSYARDAYINAQHKVVFNTVRTEKWQKHIIRNHSGGSIIVRFGTIDGRTDILFIKALKR